MTELLWIRSHVEVLLARHWDLCRVVPDADGDYVFRQGSALCWVSVLDTDAPMVRVTAHAAYGLRPTSKVLRELNDIQNRSLSAAIRLTKDVVVVTQTLSPIALSEPVLAQALSSVADVAADVGPLLAAMFDGATPLPVPDPVAAGSEPETDDG